MGRFRAPTLRNIALTAPYMHDGSVADARRASIAHYAGWWQGAAQGAAAQGLRVVDGGTDDLIAFLESLTDTAFVTNPRFADPGAPGRPAARLAAPIHDRRTPDYSGRAFRSPAILPHGEVRRIS